MTPSQAIHDKNRYYFSKYEINDRVVFNCNGGEEIGTVRGFSSCSSNGELLLVVYSIYKDDVVRLYPQLTTKVK